MGAASRLRRAVQKLAHGSHPMIKIAVIGGSPSNQLDLSLLGFCIGSGDGGEYKIVLHSLHPHSLRHPPPQISAFPRANITARNGCTPGVPTPYMIMCLELSVDPDVDLVFMEYTLNDAHSLGRMAEEAKLADNPIVKNAERLVRRVLELPNRPAVVFVHSPVCGMANYPIGHPKNPERTPYRRFPKTSEDIQGKYAPFRSTTTYSTCLYVRQCTVLLYTSRSPGFFGRICLWVALGLMLEPYSPADEEAVSEPLPEPMYEGNIAPNTVMCSVAESFHRLQLAVNTDRSAVGSPAGEKVHVYVHHLRSYEHMGVAEVSCISGCSCDPTEVDALIQEEVSQVYLVGLVVSQSTECVIEVLVLNRTSSGEHKFKVSGVVVAETAGKQKGIAGLDAAHDQHFGLRQHLDENEGVEVVTLTSAQMRTADR
ncbi:hypothetical protein VOLCADRAFT_85815 [Volvox carteri f. nagariensis]|uniref:SGNH hydrolase-type esterase domain-containing protein n=1 Tax=Volvox carteri f. nagariensis TaxID=3068 RepID=D8TH25_VOLCA|nr:uncharacterized protein VOLCADRAFT_85815 [Volvox carteri f. nagariensis]EFJ52999.1 hypothetical protein VOLCADRAFT_85815 [Volvox carteri f. nagariensis]|eukprot:XP_002946004.1 hypothetical protein VOLCADRAFT_85815 [Volvox carteri f. nagariensis]